MTKRISLIVLCIALVLSLASCAVLQLVCPHNDKDNDYRCDLCGVLLADIADRPPDSCTHRDADDNSKCDICGEDLEDGNEPMPCTHRDSDDNSKCDICDVDFADGTILEGMTASTP